jgi:acetyl-CoA carboxylase biotin carboxyl carrier protein
VRPARRGVEREIALDKEILELIELISESNFVEFELEREGFKIKLVKAGGRAQPAGPLAPVVQALDAASPAPHPVPAMIGSEAGPRLHEIKSPLVGTFYRSASPDSPTFTEAGKAVRAGQVLCIVEAMKLMNEIECDIDGTVEEVVVSNGQPVEYGEVLFRIRPGEAVP